MKEEKLKKKNSNDKVLTNHPLKFNKKSRTEETEEEEEEEEEEEGHSRFDKDSYFRNSVDDITRPTLKRITADHQQKKNHSPSNSINQNIWLKSSNNNNHNNSSVIHLSSSPKQESLSQKSIHFKFDGDVLIHHVQPDQSLPGIALSYGISLSALRKANRMWSSDPLNIKTTLVIPVALCNLPPRKKIEIEQSSGKVLVLGPHSRSSESSSSLSNLTIHSDQPFASTSNQTKNWNLIKNQDQNNLSSSDIYQSQIDFDHSSSLSNRSSCDSYQYPQLGQLAPISNTESLAPISNSIVNLASRETFQSNLSDSKSNQTQLLKGLPSDSSLASSLIIPNSKPISSSSSGLLHSSSNNLRQRTRPFLSPPLDSSTSSSTKTLNTLSTQVCIPSEEISPKSKQKHQFNFFSSNPIRSVSPFLHSNLNQFLGNEEEIVGGERSKGKSKWTTVRPGKPPPLGQALSFLEEPTTLSTNKIGLAVSNVIEGFFNSTNLNSTQKKDHQPSDQRQRRVNVDQSRVLLSRTSSENVTESHEL